MINFIKDFRLRRDIQFLRGITVLVVVLYHSNLGFLNQGYLSVKLLKNMNITRDVL